MYAVERLLADAAYLAHHLHWSLDTVLDLEHHDREFFVAQVESWFTPTDVDQEHQRPEGTQQW